MTASISIPAMGLLLTAASIPTLACAACVPPAPGVAHIEGVVRAAVDGATVCIQTGADHLDLTRVRLADLAAPPLTAPGGEGAKWALRRAARGRAVACEVEGDGSGVCRAGKVSVGHLVTAKRR